MAKIKEREKAIELRKKGMSYSQIREKLGTPKSTLSNWLKDHPLSKERIRELQTSEKKIERFRETMRKKKEKRLNKFYNEEKKNLFPIKNKNLYIAGLFLYWGEGTKGKMSRLTLTNSDPALIKFFIRWGTESLGADKESIKICLHLYNDMDIKKEIDFWSKELKIPTSQFIKPYIKESKSTRINHKGGFKHGTCSATIANTELKERVMMAIKAVQEEGT